ncbi:hypothetical protein [Nocardioides sp. zg-DK7169]|uniref:hypothetical protein n=1 Tax=Nocardioides sp. zg-DK7169 TaxID=2736600 RepID=UPI0015527E2E|nr:hypothetical protein [Nocardioides sp. zg-DK7169]NPC95437.1 hypothetical protein [Nocardioides sp. zg-DK7169]
MQRGNDDEVWRGIVENYGERPQLDDAPAPVEPAEPEPEPFAAYVVDPDPEPEEGFVPPTPPPLPRPTRDRFVAWAGVFGSPAILLLCLLFGVSLPGIVSYLLVSGFVGGFVYLVWRMPREPRDPWDDGARV